VLHPRITVRNAKLYIDGVISGPAFTGAMIEPYRVNAGTATEPRWQDGPSRGPDPYYPAPVLADFLTRLARAGIDPHMHVDGDLAVRVALDGIEAMRRAVPGTDIRPSLAHDEIVARADYPRYKALGVHPVLSFQWEKPAPDTVEQARDFLGPERAAILEPAGLLHAAGAAVAFGSDWPVDALDEWFALKVAVTRENAPASGYSGRLGEDPGLTPLQALRAATITAAHALHDDARVGSLENGKLGDLIILDRNPLAIASGDIANVRILETVVGGEVVWRAP
jgi:predicted amidohydrolase YtcJ